MCGETLTLIQHHNNVMCQVGCHNTFMCPLLSLWSAKIYIYIYLCGDLRHNIGLLHSYYFLFIYQLPIK